MTSQVPTFDSDQVRAIGTLARYFTEFGAPRRLHMLYSGRYRRYLLTLHQGADVRNVTGLIGRILGAPVDEEKLAIRSRYTGAGAHEQEAQAEIRLLNGALALSGAPIEVVAI